MKKLLPKVVYSALVGAGMLFSAEIFAQCPSSPLEPDFYKLQTRSFALNYDHKNACVDWQDPDNPIVTCEPITDMTATTDIHVVKMTKDGQKIWEFTYDLRGTDVPQSVIKVSGGYVIAGITNGGGTDAYTDIFLMKIDNSGNFLWSRNYETKPITYNWGSATVTELEQGNLIVVGHTDVQTELHTVYFLKTDANGQNHQFKRYRMTGRRYQSWKMW